MASDSPGRAGHRSLFLFIIYLYFHISISDEQTEENKIAYMVCEYVPIPIPFLITAGGESSAKGSLNAGWDGDAKGSFFIMFVFGTSYFSKEFNSCDKTMHVTNR